MNFQNLWEVKAKLPEIYNLAREKLERHYNHVNNIDLKELYQKTRSHYYVTQCQLQKIDWYVNLATLMLLTDVGDRVNHFRHQNRMNKNYLSRFAWRLKYTLRGACLMLDAQEVYSRERKLRATFKNHLNSAHLQKVSNTLLQDLVKLPTLQPAYTVKGSLNIFFL